MEKNANGTAFVIKKLKLNGKKVVYEHTIRKLLHILTQKKKIVTYTFTQFFKWNHDYSFFQLCSKWMNRESCSNFLLLQMPFHSMDNFFAIPKCRIKIRVFLFQFHAFK